MSEQKKFTIYEDHHTTTSDNTNKLETMSEETKAENTEGNGDLTIVRRSYSWDELYKLRCFVQAQRFLIKERHEESQSEIESMCLAFAANALCDIMDEITAMLEDDSSLSYEIAEKIKELEKKVKKLDLESDNFRSMYEAKKRRVEELENRLNQRSTNDLNH